MEGREFLPENHEYVTHKTYTGPGCAHCGKSEPGHKPIWKQLFPGGGTITFIDHHKEKKKSETKMPAEYSNNGMGRNDRRRCF